MNLEELLLLELEKINIFKTKKGFGWMIIYSGKNMLGGYKTLDDNILILFLILSEKGFKKSLNEEFTKFDFGKTWAETELNRIDDIPRIVPYLKDAVKFMEERNKLKSKKY